MYKVEPLGSTHDSDRHSDPDSDHHSDLNSIHHYIDPNDDMVLETPHMDLNTVHRIDPDIVPAVPAETLSPNLPVLVLSTIIQCGLLMDMTMLGTFNRVTSLFRELTLPFLPSIYIRASLVESLNIERDDDYRISISRLYKAAGRNSGLVIKIRELFSQNTKWFTTWIVIWHMSSGWYLISDIFWKK